MSKRSTQAKKREAERRAARPGSLRRAVATWPRRRLIAAICLATMLALVGGSVASFRVSRSNKAKQAERAQVLQPQDASSPSKEYIYLGAGGRLIETEEPATAPGTPTGLVAAFLPPATISLTWNPSSGQVVNYEVWRSTDVTVGFGTNPVGTPTSNSFNDSPGSTPAKTYVYRVRAIGQGGAASGYSNIDFATIYAFTNPSPSHGSIVRASDINDVRAAIDLVRASAHLGAGSYTFDPGTINNTIKIKAAHISEMRSNLDGAINVLVQQQYGLPQPPPYAGGLGPGAVVNHIYVSELRDRVK